MENNGQDKFLEEIDHELRTLNKRLKDVMSEADALLSEHLGKEQEEAAVDASEEQNGEVKEEE